MFRRNVPAAPDTLAPPELADELLDLKAAVAELTVRERELKDALIASGITEVEGERARATVSTHERTTLDVEAAKEKLGPAWCRRHSTTKEQTVVRVSARKRVD
ncbi:MAG TPA: hypothetical protein ENH55_13385 [Aurantimonas coralicida]|uniref:Uncharacterized protein n=2 Tax=root TaxID=1 RepID=A0A9C9ND83_9HYPH|nr:hypothetical protein [Aurantimonas coralicida]HET99646.1 hypothetical protein [Aurantimonas coralicida]